MNTSIELHDSTVGEISEQGVTVEVHFLPAYIHKSEGRPGVDSGTGWTQEARLIFTEAAFDGAMPELPCHILDGDLIFCTVRHNNEIPVPLDATGSVELQLVFDSVHRVTIKGQGVRLHLLGEAKYVEEFKPKSPAG